jgi:thioredoxin:protein disulfide reductase
VKKQLAVLLFALLATTASFAQFGMPDATPKVTIDGSLQSRSGDTAAGTILAHVATGWHVNSHTPSEEFAIPTVLTLEGAELASAQYPPHVMKAFEFTGGKPLAVYDGTVAIAFTAKVPAGVTKFRAKLHYQACSDRVCLPPRDAFADIDANAIAAAPSTAKPAAPAASGTFTPLSAAPKNAAPANRIAQAFASQGLLLSLALLFLGGLALNLTPCVFPLIPITLGFFAMQSDGRRSRRFALSLMYVLGIVITYSALGVLAALGGKMFGAWMQLPVVLIGFALLMLVLASSMFGAFEIQAPRFIANRSQGRAGLAGALSMGLVIGIVAAPCVGPFVISLITYVAQLGDPVRGGFMFFVLGFGLGFPYLVMLNALPRPGEWMVTVKKGMGFVLVAMAFYFLRALVGEEVFRYGVAASLIVGAGFLLMSRTRGARAFRFGVGVLLLVCGVAFALPRKESRVTWERYDEQTLAAAKNAHKPVIVDFYADWCIPCKELDQKTFSDDRVAAELERFTHVKADLTAPDSATTQALTKQYAILGVPTLVLIDANGNEVPAARLTGYEAPDAFVQRLRQVK